MRSPALLLSAGLLVTLLSCTRGPAPRAPVFTKAPIVLVSIDTLRSDHLPDYGYRDVETPAISALARESVIFRHAYSPVPLTLPAHLSVLTGLLPSAHGVHDNLGYTLRPEVPTLTEILRKEGYATGGAVSAVVLAGAGGTARGFEFWDEAVEPTSPHEALGRVQRTGLETEALLEGWIASQGERPFFAFLHVYEPHAPYEPPEPFRDRFASPYDGEIAAADAVVGKLAAFLRGKGIWDRALVVLLSDHGESLGEHGEDEHGVFLYRADLEVPLLLKPPLGSTLAGTSVDAPVALTDLFTTLLEVVGARGVPERKDAVSLLALAAGAPAPRRTLFAETFFPRIHFGWSDLQSASDGRWHYIEAPRPELYDLSRDPGETSSRIEERPDALRSLRAALLGRPLGFTAPAAVDEEQKRKLASLGYLSTGASTGGGPLPDPKDHVGTIRLLSDAVARAEQGEGASALGLFEQLLRENPRMSDVWELYSNTLVAAGRPDEALAARRKMVDLAPPGGTYALLSVANLCLEIGRPEEAGKHALLARERGDPAADEVLARVALSRGDAAGAEAAARLAAQHGKTRRRALLLLARAAVLRGKPADALPLIDEAAAGGAPIVGLHRLRGNVLARLSRMDEAGREFEEEIRLFPHEVDARVELAVVHASQRRLGEARRTLETLLREVPTADAYAKTARTLEVLGDRTAAADVNARGRARFPKDPRAADRARTPAAR